MQLRELFSEQESPQYRLLVNSLPVTKTFNQFRLKEVPAGTSKKETVLQFGNTIVRHILHYDKLGGYLIFSTYEGKFMANMLTGDTVKVGTNMDLLDMIVDDTVKTGTEFSDITSNRCIVTKSIKLDNKQYYIGVYSLASSLEPNTKLDIPLKLKQNTLLRVNGIRGRIMAATRRYTLVRNLPDLSLVAINNYTLKITTIEKELVNVRELKDGLFRTTVKYQTSQNRLKVYKLGGK